MDAKTAEKQQGPSILSLNLSFLLWKEAPNSEVVCEALLLLLPTDLVRNDQTSSHDIFTRDYDLTINLTRPGCLRHDFVICIREIEENQGRSPAKYFDSVLQSVASQSGQSVDVDVMQLGFLSFAMLLMHRDPDPANWANGHLTRNCVAVGSGCRRLCAGGVHIWLE